MFSADFLGGSELFNLEFLRRAHEREVQIDAIVPGAGSLSDALEPLVRSVITVRPPDALTSLSRFDNGIRWRQLPRYAWEAVSYGRRLRQALAHTDGPVCCLGFRAQLAVGFLARPRGRRIAWIVHEVIPSGPFGAVWTKASRRASAIYAYSRAAGMQPRLAGRPVHILPAHLELTKFAELAPPAPPVCVLGLVGDLFRIKNHLALIELVRRLRGRGHQVEGLIVGRPQLQEDPKYSELITEAVTQAGFNVALVTANPSEMPARIKQMDVLIHVTTVPESFGRVCIEAMAAARPVVAFDHGAVGDIVQQRKTGYLVPPGDMDALEGALLELIENPRLFKEMGTKARQIAITQYSDSSTDASIGDALAALAES